MGTFYSTSGIGERLCDKFPRNNSLFRVSYSGTTDSGFTVVAGTENASNNGQVVRGTFNFQWRHPDGSKYVEHGRFVFNLNKDESLVDGLSSKCIGNS